MSEQAVRWAGVAGIVFVVLILVGVFAGGSMPKLDDPVSKLRHYYVDHRGALLITNMLALVSIPFVLWFAVVLREVLRGVGDRLTNALATASLVGLVVTAPMAMIGGALTVAPVYVKGQAQTFGGDTLRIMFVGQSLAFAATAAGITLFVLAAGAAIRRGRALPAYAMWIALLAVIGNVVTMFSTLGSKAAGLGFLGVTTFSLFVLVTGITMAIGKAKLAPSS